MIKSEEILATWVYQELPLLAFSTSIILKNYSTNIFPIYISESQNATVDEEFALELWEWIDITNLLSTQNKNIWFKGQIWDKLWIIAK